MGPHFQDKHLRLLPHDQGGAAAPEEGKCDRKHRIDHRPRRQQGIAGLFGDQGCDSAFTKSLAQNLVEKGIRVNCVAPGPVWTPLNPSDKPAKDVAEFGADTPMERPAQPEEIAPAFVYFASEADSSYVTGEVLTLLGGETTAA